VKYRIKIETYANGEIVIRCEFKKRNNFFGTDNWVGVCYDGDELPLWSNMCACVSREEALARIDLHYKRNYTSVNKPVKVDVEYINK